MNNQNSDNPKLNDVVMAYFGQYGFPYTVEHYPEIRDSYYGQKCHQSQGGTTNDQYSIRNAT